MLYPESKSSNALSLIFSIVLTSIFSSTYSTTRLSLPAQVTAPNTKLTLAKGKAPPGFMVSRSNSSAPYLLGKSMRVRLVTAVPIAILSSESIFSLLRSDTTTSSRLLKADSFAYLDRRSGTSPPIEAVRRRMHRRNGWRAIVLLL